MKTHTVQRAVAVLRFMFVLIFVGLITSLGTAFTAHAQNAKAAQVGVSQQGSYEQKVAQYNLDKKSEGTAAFMGLIWPTWGASYAGDVHQGTNPAILAGAGLAIMVAGFAKTSPALMGIGVLGLNVGEIWGGVASYNAAADHNERLKRQLALSPQ